MYHPNPRRKRKQIKKESWNLEPLEKALCPPFCEDLSEDEQDRLRDEDLGKHYGRAKSFKDLLKLNLDFIRGERASPRYFASIHDGNPETITSLRKLAEINSLGLLTVDSQPGEVDPKHAHKQRAYLVGVSNEKLAFHLYEELNHHLIVSICPIEVNLFNPDATNNMHLCGAIAVTYDAGEPFTHVGGHTNTLQHDMEYLDDKLVDKLYDRAYNVTIIDPTWGRHAADPGHMLDQIISSLKQFSGNRYCL